jgi:signal transduction histidine kinase
LAVALWTLAAPLVDGSASAINYAGGFPIASVMLWAYARGLPGGFAAGAAASLVVISSGDYSTSGKISTTVLYVMTGLLVAWGAGVLRRNEATRLELQEDLAAERAQRERSEERADLAARIHDSVLQTLALIQRRADDPQQVQSLARQQEHDLRSWLFAPSAGDLGDSLAAAVGATGREVEDRYQVKVDVVTVGDCELDERLGALVDASREALVNAAKFSGVSDIAVYLEVDPTQSAVYVRDRGAGFDPADVDADRRGIADSIVGRMERYGGTAVVRSAPGRGTPVSRRRSATPWSWWATQTRSRRPSS